MSAGWAVVAFIALDSVFYTLAVGIKLTRTSFWFKLLPGSGFILYAVL